MFNQIMNTLYFEDEMQAVTNKQIKCEVYEDIRRKDEEEAVDGSPPGAKACSYSMRYLTNVRRCYTFIN